LNEINTLDKKCEQTEKLIAGNIKSEASLRKEEIKKFEDE